MALFTVNHKAASGDFEPLPIGTYECIVTEVRFSTSQGAKTKDAPVVQVTLTIRDDVQQEGQRRKFFDNLIIHPNTEWRVQQFCRALGIPDGKTFDSLEDFGKEIIYKAVRVQNRHEKGNDDRLRDRVDRYLPSEAPARSVPQADPFSIGTPVPPGDSSIDEVPF